MHTKLESKQTTKNVSLDISRLQIEKTGNRNQTPPQRYSQCKNPLKRDRWV